MTKQQMIDAIQFASQTLPFLMITAMFIALAYSYGQSLTPYHMGDSCDLIRLSCNYLP